MLGHLETRKYAIYRNTRSAKGLGKRSVAQSIDTHSGVKDVEFLNHEFSALCTGYGGDSIAVAAEHANRDGAGAGPGRHRIDGRSHCHGLTSPATGHGIGKSDRHHR